MSILRSVYSAILGAAPNAKVYVGGYPDLFGWLPRQTPFALRCELVGAAVSISYFDTIRINWERRKLNGVIEDAVKSLQ